MTYEAWRESRYANQLHPLAFQALAEGLTHALVECGEGLGLLRTIVRFNHVRFMYDRIVLMGTAESLHAYVDAEWRDARGGR